MNKLIDLTGRKFGRLTVIKRAENNKYGQARWLCQCDCGTIIITNSTSLINGGSKYKNKWKAEISKNGEMYYLGLFETPEEAAHMYDKKAKELFGEFAKLNYSDCMEEEDDEDENS